jgi:hypothetical protein
MMEKKFVPEAGQEMIETCIGGLDLGNPEEIRGYMITNTDIKPNNWTMSESFVDTGRTAEYTTVWPFDIGVHNIIINVTDEAGLTDWQNISILVGSTPKARADGKNAYPDIPRDRASIEDFYTLDASMSMSFFGDSNFSWEVTGPLPLQRRFVVDGKIVVLPPLTTSIDEMTDTTLNKLAMIHNDSGLPIPFIDIDATLIVTGPLGPSPPDTFVFKLYECLPHRQAQTAKKFYMWPYTQPTMDPFMASHLCCRDDTINWGTYHDTETACYNTAQWGALPGFEDLEADQLSYVPANAETELSYQNDIFKRTFTRFCSGKRGNICSGTKEELREVFEECADPTDAADWQCSGPRNDLFATPLNAEPENPSQLCVIYEYGDTFNKFNQGLQGDISCDPTPRKSRGKGLGNYDTGGLFNCRGYCGGPDQYCTYADDCVCSGEELGCVVCGGLTYEQVQEGFCIEDIGVFCAINCCQPEPDGNEKSCECKIDQTPGDAGKEFLNSNLFDAGTFGNCCGDDPGEYYEVAETEIGGSGVSACCDMQNECIDGAGVCMNMLETDDLDVDEIPNCYDNCPDVYNPVPEGEDEQADNDDDGMGNECDPCPGDPDPQCGIAIYIPPDTDGDGVSDEADNCPDDYNPNQEDENNNGVGDACEGAAFLTDSDEDGVPDIEDFCPMDPTCW